MASGNFFPGHLSKMIICVSSWNKEFKSYENGHYLKNYATFELHAVTLTLNCGIYKLSIDSCVQ